MEFGGSISESFPIEENRCIFSLMSNKIFSNNYHANSSRSQILLSSSIDDSIFFPINWSSTDIWTHITDKSLSSNLLIREVIELNSMNSFIITIVEICSFWVNVPGIGVRNCVELWTTIWPNLISLANFLSFLYGWFWPSTSCQVICLSLILENVIGNSWELHRSTTLEEENLIVRWDIEKFSEIFFCLFSNWDKLLWTVTHLQNRDTTSMPIYKLLLCLLKDLLR